MSWLRYSVLFLVLASCTAWSTTGQQRIQALLRTVIQRHAGYEPLQTECEFTAAERHECGKRTYDENECHKRGCCYEICDSANCTDVPWCFLAKRIVDSTAQSEDSTVGAGTLWIRRAMTDGGRDPPVKGHSPTKKSTWQLAETEHSITKKGNELPVPERNTNREKKTEHSPAKLKSFSPYAKRRSHNQIQETDLITAKRSSALQNAISKLFTSKEVIQPRSMGERAVFRAGRVAERGHERVLRRRLESKWKRKQATEKHLSLEPHYRATKKHSSLEPHYQATKTHLSLETHYQATKKHLSLEPDYQATKKHLSLETHYQRKKALSGLEAELGRVANKTK